MTPEGLNARLTFLNQCVRPGETIPVIGVDGKPKYNDAVNTSFGAPPVLVLRIGDFYNCKIIPKAVSFSYDPLVFDMNPEGIGSVGSVTLVYNGGATPTGVVGTGSVGTAIANVIKNVIGVQGSGQIGTVSVKVSDRVIVTGVQGTGAIGTVFIRGWTVINDSQTPNWADVSTTQNPGWTDIPT